MSTGGWIERNTSASGRPAQPLSSRTTLVDRGDVASSFFSNEDVPYEALLNYNDLGIPPVGGASEPLATAG